MGPNIGGSGLTFLIISYCDRIKVNLLADKNVQIDAKVLIAHLEEKLDQLISQNSVS